MTASSTTFRKAVAELVSTATGIGLVVHGEREGRAVDGGDLVAVWTSASSANEDNRHFRMYAVTARVLLAVDPEVTPDEDDPLDELEQHEAAVLAAVTPYLGGARVDSFDAVFLPSDGAIDFLIVGEVENAESEV